MITINKLSKYYGSYPALKDINLQISPGQVIGLLGPNGSGKTTLIKILVGLTTKYEGEIKVDGQDIGPHSKSIISYLPDRSITMQFNRVEQALDYYQDFFDDFNRSKAEAILTSLDLSPSLKLKDLSKGMLEKVHLSLVLGRDAKIYIFDEPIAGVDPVARDQIMGTIIDNISTDSTMIISTHLVKDIEQIFDSVIFISEGEVIDHQNTEDIRLQMGQSVEERYKELFGHQG